MHETGLDARALGFGGMPQLFRPCDGRGEPSLGFLQIALGNGELFGFQLALDFERAQFAEQRLLLRRERVRFALQRANPLGGALRGRLGCVGACAQDAAAPRRRSPTVSTTASKQRLAIDVSGNLHTKILQHGRRDIHDRGPLAQHASGLKSAPRRSSRNRSRRDRRSISSCSGKPLPAALRRASSATRRGSPPPCRPAARTHWRGTLRCRCRRACRPR